MSTNIAVLSRGTPVSLVLPCLARGLAAPFDFARDVHAQAVKAGIIERSMLESAKFEYQLDALEHLLLGMFARTR
jgi:hypothetical protein